MSNRKAAISRQKSINEMLGRFFSKHRIIRGVSLTELSQVVGVSRKNLMSFEAGKVSLPLHTIFALAQELRISARRVIEIVQALKSDDEIVGPQAHYFPNGNYGKMIELARGTVGQSLEDASASLQKIGELVSAAELKEIESGSTDLSVSTYFSLCEVFDLPLDSVSMYSKDWHLGHMERKKRSKRN